MPRVRYETAPEFVMHYPTCGACLVDLDHDGDGWQCPKCGTAWDANASDGDVGDLYADWSGDDTASEIPAVSHQEGAVAAWIEHPYQKWVTENGLDMRVCRGCYRPESLHVKAGSNE